MNASSFSPQLKTIRPALRGERSALCTGILHETKGHYGWILPHETIDHPEARKHRGGIYLDTRDIRPGTPLVKGDEVAFYLYADSHGLGAEDCHLKCAVQEKPDPSLTAWTTLRPRPVHTKPKARGCQTLSIADLLDHDDGVALAQGKVAPAKDKTEDPHGLANDPVLQILLQPRKKDAKVDLSDDSASTSAGTSSSQSSPGAVSLEPQFPAGAAGSGDAASEADDLFEVLRKELREARARAGGGARPAAGVKEPETSSGLFLPAGFTPPPGLSLPAEAEGKGSPALPIGPPPGL